MSEQACENGLPELLRRVHSRVDKDGNIYYRSMLTSTNMKVRALCVVPPDKVIPIVFLPGVMGSRLRVKDKKALTAWHPPENILSSLADVISTALFSAATRQKELDPDNTEVDETSYPYSGKNGSVGFSLMPDEYVSLWEQARWRGWGQIYNGCYIGMLDTLEEHCNSIVQINARPVGKALELSTEWRRLVLDKQEADIYLTLGTGQKKVRESKGEKPDPKPGKALGAQKPFECLEEEDLRKLADCYYPVHAVGYNWIRSNQEAAERLRDKIDEITGFYRSIGRKCDKVILVTHSMGGLVARLAVQLPGVADKVLGVVHGVMPAIGAPAAYKRMRAGFEGAEQAILGKNAAVCTAVLATAPGSLELLPHPAYRTYEWKQGEYGRKALDEKSRPRHWLRVCKTIKSRSPASRKEPEEFVDLGDPGDYLNSIYLPNDKRVWWRTVKEELIDPAGKIERAARRKEAEKRGEAPPEDKDQETDFKQFAETMKTVKQTHQMLEPSANSYHPNTYAFYGADGSKPAWNEVCWRLTGVGAVGSNWLSRREPMPDCTLADEELADNLNGKVKIRLQDVKLTFEIEGAQGAGDGTVPLTSGASPTPYCKQIFRHEGMKQYQPSYSHMTAYDNNDIATSVTLYSIAHMVLAADKGAGA